MAPDGSQEREGVLARNDVLGDVVFVSRPGASRESEALLRKAYGLFYQLASDFPQTGVFAALSAARSDLIKLLEMEGRIDDALAIQRNVVELWRRTYESDPNDYWPMLELGRETNNMGVHLEWFGRFRDAEVEHREALRVRQDGWAKSRQSGGSDVRPNPGTSESLCALASVIGKQADELYTQGRLIEAEEYYRKAMTYYDQLPVNRTRRLAWDLATWRDPRFRDPGRAVELSRYGVDRSPRDADWVETLGHAQYRAGKMLEALSTLEASMRLRNCGDAETWFLIAMAYRQLGDAYGSLMYYLAAVRWMDTYQPCRYHLRELRAEAAALLGVKYEPRAEVGMPRPPED
ncbi:MAG TPA: tetratricopeptide repeat protein [Gemmataceae bacterium]|jgi:tetratricopeptide (TPR) repeat protein|nr:tetratricopeptide repeat protein [Gemmataceae bacterium]